MGAPISLDDAIIHPVVERVGYISNVFVTVWAGVAMATELLGGLKKSVYCAIIEVSAAAKKGGFAVLEAPGGLENDGGLVV